MVSFEGKEISSNISLFDLYVQKEDDNFSGTVRNDFYQFAFDFCGVREMLRIMEELFNYVNFPMATHEERVFDKKKQRQYSMPKELYRASAEDFGKQKPSFRLHVQFRQNTTWQGVVEWVSMKKKKQFRSELELIRLMVEAADYRDEPGAQESGEVQ